MAVSATFAKARFMGLKELAATSDIVAVISVTETTSLGPMGSEGLPKKGHWTYTQNNTFRFVEVLKTSDWIHFDQEQDQMLWAEKTFICARASYAPGKYVAFLKSVGTNEWITVNHHLGGLRIDDDGNVPAFNWYLDSANNEKTLSLNEVKRKIQKISASLLPPILACEQSQHRVVLLDANKRWNNEAAILWQWSAGKDDGITDEHKAWFSHPSDAKCIATNQQVLTVASGGGMALVDVKTRQVVGYGYAGSNPHSASLLPDGRIVTASSTGDLVQLFERQADKQPLFQVIQKLEMTDAHGVVWDELRRCVWAMGGKQIKRFDYDHEKPSLTLIKTIDLPETEHPRFGGHDLVLQAADDTLWLSDMEHLWSFDPKTDKFAPLPPHRMGHVKSISRLTDPELTIMMQATTDWWSDTVRSLEGTWQRTLPDAKFYKARWWSVNPLLPTPRKKAK